MRAAFSGVDSWEWGEGARGRGVRFERADTCTGKCNNNHFTPTSTPTTNDPRWKRPTPTSNPTDNRPRQHQLPAPTATRTNIYPHHQSPTPTVSINHAQRDYWALHLAARWAGQHIMEWVTPWPATRRLGPRRQPSDPRRWGKILLIGIRKLARVDL